MIRQRSKGDQPHQQLYGSYTTNRMLGLADLDALDDRLARDKKVMGGYAGVLFAVIAAAAACFIIDAPGVVSGRTTKVERA